MAQGARVLLTDFGLAKDCTTGSRLTRTGTTLGTPAYMSPEQARGEHLALGAASDVWSLGCVLYECLAGRRAFDGDSPAAIVGQVVAGRPLPLRSLRPGLPRPVLQLAAACLARSVAVRPDDAGSLRLDLARVLADQRPLHRPPRRLLPLGIASAVGLVALVGAMLGPGRESPVRTRRDSASTVLASEGWSKRGTEPAVGARLLARALEKNPERHDWRLRYGVLRWAAGESAVAREAWASIPEDAPEHAAAQLHLALETIFGAVGTGQRITGDPRHPAAAARAPGHVGLLARALLRYDRGDRAGVLEDLRDVPGWEAAALRALATPLSEPAAMKRAYDEALAEGIQFAWLLADRAVARDRLGDLEGALADLDAALRVAPDHLHALYMRGGVRHQLGDREGAMEDFESALARFPGSSRTRFHLGVCHQRDRRFHDAIREYDRALAISPRDVAALSNRGYSKAELGDTVGAMADFDAALAIQPDFAHALRSRASMKGRLGDLDGQRTDLDAAIAADPRDRIARYNRSLLRRGAGDVRGALADLDAAVRIDPGFRSAIAQRGLVKSDLGDHVGARADYDAALAMDPRDLRTLLNRGHLRDMVGDHKGALADYTTILGIDPRYIDALYNRSISRASQGDLPGAISDLDDLLAIEPQHGSGLYNRSCCKMDLGDADGAIADLDAAIDAGHTTPEVFANRGQLHLEAGRHDQAAGDLARALELAPSGWSHRRRISSLLTDARAKTRASGG